MVWVILVLYSNGLASCWQRYDDTTIYAAEADCLAAIEVVQATYQMQTFMAAEIPQ